MWMIATFAAMQTMGPSLPSDKNPRLEASLGLNAIVRAAPKQQRVVRLAKFSRLTVLPRINLAAKTVPQKSIAAVAMARPAADFIEKTQVLALAKAAAARDDDVDHRLDAGGGQRARRERLAQGQGLGKPFSLVMQEPASSLNGMLPDIGPLPLAKPQSLADKPADRRGKKPANQGTCLRQAGSSDGRRGRGSPDVPWPQGGCLL